MTLIFLSKILQIGKRKNRCDGLEHTAITREVKVISCLQRMKEKIGMINGLYIDAACLTHMGNIRNKNEDNYYFNNQFLPLDHNSDRQVQKWRFTTTPLQSVGIFDGMGGECAGDLASYEAAKYFHEMLCLEPNREKMLQHEQITEVLIKVSDAVHDAAVEQGYKLIGSTAVLLFVHRNNAMVVNLGDSPMYCLRNGEMTLLTHAHTNAEWMRKQNIQRKPGLTQFLGISSKEFLLEPYIADLCFNKGDQFLLCSDGLTDMVSEDRIQEILEITMDVQGKCAALRDEALQNGGKDNITIILCQVQ